MTGGRWEVSGLGPFAFVFEGVLVDDGRQLFAMLTELPGAGLPAGFIGVTMTEISARQ